MEQLWNLILSGLSKVELVLLFVLAVLWSRYVKLLDDVHAGLMKRHERIERLLNELERRHDLGER